MCLKNLCKPDISNNVSLINSGYIVIWFGKNGSAKLRALPALVPHVPRSLRVLVPYVPCTLHASCESALVSHVSYLPL